MNTFSSVKYESDAVNFDTAHDVGSDADLSLLLGEDIPGAKNQDSAVVTDEEAELLLPGYALAFENYHLHRAEGASPDEALHLTMNEWRDLWAAAAYVPHRRF